MQLFITSESFLPFENGNRVNSGPQGWNAGNDLREKYLTYFRVFLTSVRHAQNEENIRVYVKPFLHQKKTKKPPALLILFIRHVLQVLITL